MVTVPKGVRGGGSENEERENRREWKRNEERWGGGNVQG